MLAPAGLPAGPVAGEAAAARLAPVNLEDTGLTERQHEVLRTLARGAANQEISRDLGILPDTVKAHVAHLLMVLGASNRTHAVDLARWQGLL